MQKSSRVVLGADDPSHEPDGQTSSSDGATRPSDPGGLIDQLEKAFAPPAAPPPELVRPSSAVLRALRRHGGRAAKIALAIAVLLVAGWQPIQRLATSASVEAMVNARLITLRSPIEGTVHIDSAAIPGARVAEGLELIRIEDPRADRSRLDDLMRQIDQVGDERDALRAKLDSALFEIEDSARQLARFQGARVRQLETRQSELRAEIKAARATRDEHLLSRQRAEVLVQRNAGSTAQLDRARRDEQVSEQLILAAEDRLAIVAIELEALREGYFVGDSYNDRPRSLERLQDVRQRAAELRAEIQYRNARHARLVEDLDREKQRLAVVAEARLAVPAMASVWEVLTASGEQVRRGQDLVRLLDCGAPLVTATVSEAVYNRLHVGAPAKFRIKDTSVDLDGQVVQLSGQAEAASNFAIAPSLQRREPYRVTVAIPGLAADGSCPIGRTGRVTFPRAPVDAP